MEQRNGKYEENRDIFSKLSDAPQAIKNVTTSISMLRPVTYCYNLIGYHDSNIKPAIFMTSEIVRYFNISSVKPALVCISIYISGIRYRGCEPITNPMI